MLVGIGVWSGSHKPAGCVYLAGALYNYGVCFCLCVVTKIRERAHSFSCARLQVAAHERLAVMQGGQPSVDISQSANVHSTAIELVMCTHALRHNHMDTNLGRRPRQAWKMQDRRERRAPAVMVSATAARAEKCSRRRNIGV